MTQWFFYFGSDPLLFGFKFDSCDKVTRQARSHWLMEFLRGEARTTFCRSCPLHHRTRRQEPQRSGERDNKCPTTARPFSVA